LAVHRNCGALFALNLVTVILLCALSPLPGFSEGLNLKETQEKSLESFDKPNPHFALACSECHAGNPILGKDTADTVTFVNGEGGSVDLCEKCHDPMDNIHPVNVDPAQAVPPVSSSCGAFPHGRTRRSPSAPPSRTGGICARPATAGTRRLIEICDFCHAATKGGHYLMVNPFADPNLAAQVAASTLPRQGGAYTCISFHNPHGGTGEAK